MAETKTSSGKIEREYTIPIREKIRVVPRYKKTNKAIKTIREFLARHMKVRDRDLSKIKIDKYLNEVMWQRGIKHPVHKIKVKAIKEGDIVRAELAEMPEKIKYKKLREDKITQEAEKIIQSKKTMMEKVKESKTPKEVETQKTEESVTKSEESKEKEKTSAEATKQIEKTEAKRMKHTTKTAGKMSSQKHQQRKALAK